MNAYELFVSYYEADRKKYTQAKFRRRLLFQMQLREQVMKKQNGQKTRAFSPTPVPSARQYQKAKQKHGRKRAAAVNSNARGGSYYDDEEGRWHHQLNLKREHRKKCKVCLHMARLKKGKSPAFQVSSSLSKHPWACSVSGAVVCQKHWQAFHQKDFGCHCWQYEDGSYRRAEGAQMGRGHRKKKKTTRD